MKTEICKACGRSFAPTAPHANYCSPECFAKSQKNAQAGGRGAAGRAFAKFIFWKPKSAKVYWITLFVLSVCASVGLVLIVWLAALHPAFRGPAQPSGAPWAADYRQFYVDAAIRLNSATSVQWESVAQNNREEAYDRFHSRTVTVTARVNDVETYEDPGQAIQDFLNLLTGDSPTQYERVVIDATMSTAQTGSRPLRVRVMHNLSYGLELDSGDSISLDAIIRGYELPPSDKAPLVYLEAIADNPDGGFLSCADGRSIAANPYSSPSED